MPEIPHLLHLEKNEDHAALVVALLAEEGFDCRVIRVTSLAGFTAALAEEGAFDLVLSDLSRSIDGFAALSVLRETRPGLPLIFVTDTSGEETIVTALKNGASDYVLKGRLSRLAPAMKSALTEAGERRWRQAGVIPERPEGLYQSLVDNIAIGISLISPDMRILSMNRTMKGWFPHVDPSAKPICYQQFNTPPRKSVCGYCPVVMTLADGKVHEATTETPTGGTVRNYKVIASPVRDWNENVIGAIEMVEDVTERKRMEEELRHSNELLRAVIRASPLATVLLDPEGRVTLWNAAAEGIFGWSQAEVLGNQLPIIPEDKQSEFAELRSRVLRGEFLAGVDIRRRQKQGRLIDISLHAAPVRDGAGSVVGIMSVMADISERKRAERELLESEQRFRASFEDAAIGMCLTGLGGRFLTVNRAFGAMLGYEPEELTALDLFQVTHPDDLEKSRRWHEGMLAGAALPAQMEKRYVTREGKTIWGAVSKKLLHDIQGEPLYFINQIQDITERRSLELQLLHAQKMEAVGTLTGGIAHDFNNLLTAIVGYCGLLEMKLAPRDPLAGHVAKILGAADRATILIKSLLSFSRIRTIEPKTVDLNGIVTEVEELLRRVLRENIELRISLDEDPILALADVGQIEQVLMNLATNARDAMPSGGMLVIETAIVDLDKAFVAAHSYGAPGRYAMLTVSDNGQGMDEATRKRIFEPFFTTKEVGQGTGLGLSVVYGIVKQHQGFINCYSEPGKGTAFRIYLPAAEYESGNVAQPAKPWPSVGTETILLGEDDPQLRTLTREVLERFGYTVIEAADGEEAIKRFHQHEKEIALALLDVVMPRCGGPQAFSVMRATRPDLPVLFTSGYTADHMQLSGTSFQGQGVGFISKPVAPGDLLRTLRTQLDKHGRE